MMENVLLPNLAKIVRTEKMTAIERFLQAELLDEEFAEEFDYKPGQFMEVSVMGVGEAPISTCSIPTKKGLIDLCVRNVGRVTNALHHLDVGSLVGIRGPYGNGFPMEEMEGSNLLLVAGGLGVAPLRSVLQYALKNRAKYKDITVFYGIRTYDTMLFRDEFYNLLAEGDKLGCKFFLSYEDSNDKQCLSLEAEHSSRCMTGVVTKLFERIEVSPKDTYAIICGPPIMYKFVVRQLTKSNVPPEKIYMTLERRMKCGIGKCGHCIVGDGTSIKYVCKDGPVFTYWDALHTKGMI
ncbi:cytochrome-c3 hydrogenase subunit gamma [Candidatus Bathyarchaeota archaeon]|nr:cytochrome-c3 hydrogenase subunit gamma [Candidatus Bathyarchaeota archaeon]